MVGSYKIRKAAIFHNTGKLTPEQVCEQLGCDITVTGWMFDNRRKSKTYLRPCGWLVLDGKQLYHDQYRDFGIAIDGDGQISMSTDRSHDFLTAYPLMKKRTFLNRPCHRSFAASTLRVIIGWQADGRVWIWCDNRRKLTIRECYNMALEADCIDAVAMDCGGSVQGEFPDAHVVSSRTLATMVCLWLDKPENKKGSTDVSENDVKRGRVLSWAESQLGVIEFPLNSNRVKYNDWYYGGPGHNYAWCMTFVQWVMNRAGLPLPIKTASCTQLANWAKQHNQWVSHGYKPGDIVFFHWGADDNVTEHVGFVIDVEGSHLVTIEGNTSTADQSNGGCVMQRRRAQVNVTGAYRPWYNM